MRRAMRWPAAAVVLLTAACGGRPAGTVATPGPTAAPEQVVQALIDAVNARDAPLVQALTTDGKADDLERTWMKHGYLTDATVGNQVVGAGVGTAHPDAVGVLVTFTPQGSDGSMDDGVPVTWSFLLTDTATGWKVYDAGEG